MAIPKMTDDLNIIQALSDLPNSEDGLTADQLKAKFDAAGLAIQTYLNNTLIPALIASRIPFSGTSAIAADTVQAAIENVQGQVRDAATGTIVNGSVTREKLAEELLARVYGGLAWVSADTPDSADTPAAGFPIGQMWLRPKFTATNDAGDSWTGSGCTAEKSGYDVILTGSAQVATVTATQSLTGLGNQGDRVLVLFSVKDQDSEMTALTAALNAGAAQDISGAQTLSGALSTNGALTVQITATWPSASLADGSVTLESYTVVNLDKLMRQITGAKEIADWGSYLWGLVPFTAVQSPAAVFIQETAGVWTQTGFDVLPVTRGGTGLRTVSAGQLLYAGGTDALAALAAPQTDGSFLRFLGGAPAWNTGEQVVAALGILRLQTGTYTGTGSARTVTLPVSPKLLLIYTGSGPDEDVFSGLKDNPILLGDGAKVGESYTGSTGSGTNSYVCYVALSGAALTFSLDDTNVTNPSVQYGNRSGVTYRWVAVY